MKISKYQQTFIDAITRAESGDSILLHQRCRGRRMSHHYFLNEDHTYRPCSCQEWMGQFEMDRKIGDDIINEKHVSTVWLGLDHNYFGERPLLFETMVFDEPLGGHDIYMDRYTTWDEAVEGHKKAVQWVKDGCKDEI